MMYIKLFENYLNKTNEEIFNSSEVQKNMKRDFGSDMNYWFEEFHSKSINHIKNTYYRFVSKNSIGYGGVGNGLYLGKDETALFNFYGQYGDNKGLMKEYQGNPKWLDLTDNIDYEKFEEKLNEPILNSNSVSKIVIDMGYDGIRYYDYNATGEEFVLFNTNKIKELIK